ncbi:protein IWS1 homolog [Dendronephthya gigantea]|uniref:protein IWS1 homolog n=1 Tax=Dendronephthya gigantea TaxID=151771 RepID=UPI00106D419D|nr:protein IWS1 homolog [Dendronephthya gigantea]
MSDIEMEMSPLNEVGSEHSEVENPPTPCSYGSQDGDSKISHTNSEHEESNEEQKNEETPSNHDVPQENDPEAEENDSVVSPISPLAPISPISDDEVGNDIEIDKDAENTEPEGSKEEISGEVPKASSPGENPLNQDDSNDLNKEITLDALNEVPEKQETVDKVEAFSHEKDKQEGNRTSETVEPLDNDSEKMDIPSTKNYSGNLEESDLLNITEISDLSVDLTGDEAAIVEDILQNSGDGDLLHGGSVEERLVTDHHEEISESHKENSHNPKENDGDNEEQAGGTGELINDIFGSSDEDDEDFDGFQDDELHGTTKIKKKNKSKQEKKEADDGGEASKPETETKHETETETKADNEESLTVPPPQDSDSDDDDDERKSEIFISDFDLMMQQKKEENRQSHRRRKNVDIINDNDDLVAGIIKRMQEAAQEDRLANEARQAATKKLKLLPTVLKHMLKIDLMLIFVDSNVLPVLKEWISPLPDGSLPHIQIREGILKVLEQLPPVDSGALKVCGIGKAVMYLFRHPKETRKNKERAGKIISEWSRPIFGVTANFKSMTREEREERDYANMSKRRRLSSDGVDGRKTPKRIENAIKSDSKALRPGEKGWCMRARVPAPSNKDYVVRPKSNIDYVDFSKSSKKTLNRFEKQKRKLNEKKGVTKQRAVEISLEGRKMAL